MVNLFIGFGLSLISHKMLENIDKSSVIIATIIYTTICNIPFFPPAHARRMIKTRGECEGNFEKGFQEHR